MFGYAPFGAEAFGYTPAEAPLEEPGGGFQMDYVIATIMSAAPTITQAHLSSADTILTVSF